MFTGIVQETGIVEAITPASKSIRLAVRAKSSARDLKIGDSVAVNGCCLTAVGVKASAKTILFDLLRETWLRTNFQFLRPGSSVNLERSLLVGGRMDGHFVTGHIDGIGRIRRWEKIERDYMMEVEAPPEIMRYVIHKGSIALDGISLTIAETRKNRFRVWIIPHTYEVTNLKEKKVGEAVNLEGDLLGKYVLQLVGKNSRARKYGAVNRT